MIVTFHTTTVKIFKAYVLLPIYIWGDAGTCKYWCTSSGSLLLFVLVYRQVSAFCSFQQVITGFTRREAPLEPVWETGGSVALQLIHYGCGAKMNQNTKIFNEARKDQKNKKKWMWSKHLWTELWSQDIIPVHASIHLTCLLNKLTLVTTQPSYYLMQVLPSNSQSEWQIVYCLQDGPNLGSAENG